MPRSSTKSIAIILQTGLASILAALLGLLVNLVAGHQAPLNLLVAQRWYNPTNLVIIATACTIATLGIAFWQHSFSNKSKDQPATLEDLEDETRRVLEGYYDAAIKEGRIPEMELKAKDEEIGRLIIELQKLQNELTIRSSLAREDELSKLLDARDFDGALQLKCQQIEARRKNAKELPRELFELGTIHELRQEFPEALAAYRESWEQSSDTEYGIKYAHFAAKLNHHAEAIRAYEALLLTYKDPSDRAYTLNNLGILYLGTQRMKEAEQAYDEALAIYRKLAETNSDAFMPDVAITLNNIANLYSDTQRMKEAEQVYAEVLTIRRKLAEANPDKYLPYVANALNNLANLYRDTQRMKEAVNIYDEALDLYHKLARANPDAYLPDVAMTLNNLAILTAPTTGMDDAEKAYDEALDLRRKLARANPDAYLPNVATTLNNLGVLYRANNRMDDAEKAYDEALDLYRKLANANPDAYLPDVATTLNNLAILYSVNNRMDDAEKAYDEALDLYRKLARANPDAYLPDVAMTLNNLANFYLSADRIQEAEKHATEAERILDPLWQANPELHGNLMARILWNRALIAEASRQPSEACALARRALAAAYDPVLKQSIQKLIDRLSPGSQS
jgi:tetratricopeptide (TPR) repeat protein